MIDQLRYGKVLAQGTPPQWVLVGQANTAGPTEGPVDSTAPEWSGVTTSLTEETVPCLP